MMQSPLQIGQQSPIKNNYPSDFQLFSVAHQKYTFCQFDQKKGVILIHSHQAAIAMLAVVIF